MHDYVYHDRKMMKWMPFNALLEQGEYIRDLLEGREWIDMPTLSPDQEAELNYSLEQAYILHQDVTVTYYEQHKLHTVTGRITRIDVYNKFVFIGDASLTAHQITAIDIL
ncbi:YolD-like family protein [Candidatus Xianfuyuplasma coldseepsis]|uniref:YolD-like family protein n=1 Tax=Candidatus Xianfuyuplasma coldseepsis TaxID=2782163 RepID=A0A7L7KT03_9MOLU|nr:YolD-like family protein [Xianfuyuplasma coldseepsis]QMS85873.1 YolD-like family protein [Xianfuyuplasma coldseepsis]